MKMLYSLKVLAHGLMLIRCVNHRCFSNSIVQMQKSSYFAHDENKLTRIRPCDIIATTGFRIFDDQKNYTLGMGGLELVEKRLFVQIADGDQIAFAELYCSVVPTLKSYIYGLANMEDLKTRRSSTGLSRSTLSSLSSII